MPALVNGPPNPLGYPGSLYGPASNSQTPWWLTGTFAQQSKEELPQSVNGTSVYNSSAANHSSLNTSDNVAQAFNGLNIYGPGPAYVGKPNTSSAPANVPFSANGTRFNNPAYYTLNDGRVFFAGNVGGQNHSPRGGPSFGSYPSSPYVQHPIQQNGNTPPANSHAGVWNSASQQQQQQQPADVPDLAAPRRTSLSSTEETGPQTPFFSAHAQAYYPKITVPDNSPQTWATPSPQQLGQSVPVQAQPLWRDSEGKQYILKDLDAICQDEPAIPRPIPAIFSDDKARGTLETSLENKNHTTNVYIRGLHPNTTDDMLIAYGARFGSISSAKSMIDQHTGLCKGFGFIKYQSYADGENCIRGFFHWGYEAKWARDSNNEKLKKLSDDDNTNLYISNLPTEHDFNEHMLMAIFTDYECLSAKILRDLNGLSRGVGFARFSSPEVCKAIVQNYNGRKVGEQGLPISIRFADTPEQKRLKAVTQERRQYKTNEYNMAAFGPGSPYSQYSGVVSTVTTPVQTRAPLADGHFAQIYGYPYVTSAVTSHGMTATAPPVVQVSGAENTPVYLRSKMYSALDAFQAQAKTDGQVKANGAINAHVEHITEPQLAVQPVVKVDFEGKHDKQAADESDSALALSKRNPNVPSPSRIKKDFAVKAASTLGHDVENVSVTGSSTSSPIKHTPSKAPRIPYPRT